MNLLKRFNSRYKYAYVRTCCFLAELRTQLMTAWDDDAQFFVLTPKSSLLDLWIFWPGASNSWGVQRHGTLASDLGSSKYLAVTRYSRSSSSSTAQKHEKEATPPSFLKQ